MDRTSFLRDVLTIALEGGIDYWAVGRRADRNPDLTYNSIELRDSEDPEAEWKKVDGDSLKAAVLRIITDDDLKVAAHIKGEIAHAWATNDAGMIDATTSDVIVQIACFGEIVYG